MEAINKRVHEILDELRAIDLSREDIGDYRRYFPLVVELNELREQQFQKIQQNHVRVERAQEANERVLAEIEDNVMELQGIPLTENMATAFIIEKRLKGQFEAYMDRQIEKVFRDLSEHPARLQ